MKDAKLVNDPELVRQKVREGYTEVAKGDPKSDWGTLSKFYAQAITEQVNFEKNPPKG